MTAAYTEARSAVRRRSARVSDAVNPAKIATLPIGSIVVQIVAKSLLILMSKGDMVTGERLTPEVERERRKVATWGKQKVQQKIDGHRPPLQPKRTQNKCRRSETAATGLAHAS